MRFLLLATVLFSVFSLPLQAASSEQQALDFGTLVILANTNISSVIVKDDVSTHRALFMYLKMAAQQSYYSLAYQPELS